MLDEVNLSLKRKIKKVKVIEEESLVTLKFNNKLLLNKQSSSQEKTSALLIS